MTVLNIWRIPLLFFVSGMGVYFSMQSRTWKQLLLERASRIMIPFVFGMFVIVPVSIYLWQRYNHFGASYAYDSGHLWFLGNIFAYVLLLLPILYYLKKNETRKGVSLIKKAFRTPLGLLPVIALLILEVILVNPQPFSLYAKTWHGFFLGLITFFCGFCFVLAGDTLWKMLTNWRWLLLAIAVTLCGFRLAQGDLSTPNYRVVIESCCWIFSIFAFAHLHLNRGGRVLTYLSEAVFPVYIVHMIVQALVSTWLFSTSLAVPLQFILCFTLTLAGCFGIYELVRRVNILRPLFGLKMKSNRIAQPELAQ